MTSWPKLSGRWADMMVIAPLSANTLSKIVNGMCDNLLTSVVRAWDTTGRVDGQKKLILVGTSDHGPVQAIAGPAG